MALAFQGVLSKFPDAKPQGRGWQALCPAHDDRNPSLSITEDNGKILLHCHAGCEPDDILKAVDLQWSDCYDNSLQIGRESVIQAHNESKSPLESNLSRFKPNNSQTPQKPLRTTQSASKSSTYQYFDEDGKLLYERVRDENKKFIQRRPDPEHPCRYIYNLQGVEPTLYNIQEVKEAPRAHKPVLFVEGEKDVETLRSLGYIATTSGGTGTWNKRYTKYFENLRVILIPDNDDPGKKFMQEVAFDLEGVCSELSICILPDLPEKGDISDWLATHTKEDFEDLLTSDHLKKITCEADIATYLWSEETEPKVERRGPQIKSVWASDVSPSKPDWLWEGWLVKGGLHLLAGQQSGGKSTWVAHVIAQLIQGEKGVHNKGIKVGYMSLEESVDRLSGRLKVAGADLTKIALYEAVELDKDGNILTRTWSLPQDADVLSNWIESLELSLVVIDGLGYAIKGSQDYANTGSALAALTKAR